MLGANELMNSRLSGSEEALATIACEKLASTRAPVVLIGGLGMGFTLRAALAGLPRNASLVVAELVPAVVQWARGPMAELFGDCLSDPRLSIVEADVGDLIAGRAAAYDAILLDVDNGPDGLSRQENDRLYDPAGLERARAALRPGGILAIWSAAPDPKFAQRLARAGFTVEEMKVRANRGRAGGRHVIWFAANSRSSGPNRQPSRTETRKITR